MDEIIELLKRDLLNEYQHMHFYMYAANTVKGVHREEMSEFFKNQAKSEMEHVLEFSHVLLGLGVTDPVDQFLPCNWGYSGVADKLDGSPESLLNYAVNMENEVVENYSTRIQQVSQLEGSFPKFLEIFLEDQLLDSKNDSIHMNRMLQ